MGVRIFASQSINNTYDTFTTWRSIISIAFGEYFLRAGNRQDSFFRRLLYYAMRLGSEQIPAGKPGDDYLLPEICATAIVDYDPWKDIGVPPGQENEYINSYRLENTKSDHNYPAAFELTLVELPRFTKRLTELQTNLDKWLYAMKALGHLQEQPSCFDSPLFQLTEYQNLNKEDRKMIIDYERDRRNIANVLKREGEKSKELFIVQSLIRQTDFNDRKIASLANVTVSFVKN